MPLCVACSSDEPGKNSDGSQQEAVEGETNGADDADRALGRLISRICTVTDPDDQETDPDVTITIGKVLDPAHPYTRTLGFASVEEAEDYARSLLIEDDGHLKETADGFEYTLDGFGEISFVRTGRPDLLAFMTFVVDALPELKRIEFIPLDLWPENTSNYLYQIGDLVIDKSTGYKYVCVANCEGGRQGILMTWDGGWNYFEKKSHGSWNAVMKGCASEEAWRGLADLRLHRTTKWETIKKNYTSFIHIRYRLVNWALGYDDAYVGSGHIGTGGWFNESYQSLVYFKGENGTDLKFETTTWHTISHYKRFANSPDRCSHELRFDYNLNRSAFEEIYIPALKIGK